MAVINLDSQTIQSLGSEINALDTTLLQGYFPELESELNAIASNVQGEELNNIINTINSQFSGVKSVFSTELPKLENFLNDQMKSYTQSEEELDAELTSVLAKMASISGTTLSSSNGSSDTTTVNNADSEDNGSGLGGKMASAGLGGAAVGAIAGGMLGSAALAGTGTSLIVTSSAAAAAKGAGIAVGSKILGTTVGGKIGAALGAVIPAPVIGPLIGAGVGIAVGAATPAILNGAGKLFEVCGTGINKAGEWLDSIF